MTTIVKPADLPRVITPMWMVEDRGWFSDLSSGGVSLTLA
jgi:hypothetical protein